MWNLIIGLIMIAAALSGRFTLLGTDKSWPLIALGAGLAIWGVVQIVRSRS